MPDQPPPKRAPSVRQRQPAQTDVGRYAELHCKTNFSFLEAASHPDELVQRAIDLEYSALAVTDRNTLAGVVRAHVAAKEAGLKLLIGAEITPKDSLPIVLWASNRAGYANLSKLITHGRRRAPKGECKLMFDDVARHALGLIAGLPLQHCELENHPNSTSRRDALRYRDVFVDRCYAIAELHRGPHDRLMLNQMQQFAHKVDLPLVAANDVHYHISNRRVLHDVLTAVRHGCMVSELGNRMFANSERHLKSRLQMDELFKAAPEAVERTLEIEARCTFSLDELRYEYPCEMSPTGLSPLGYLKQLTWQGARSRYPNGIPIKVRALIEHEIRLIEELRYEGYFLTVWDLVRFARSRDILCQGRGSAANSVVCFCLGVTSVDPDRIDVLFERFVSKERDEAPDIDVDFEHERREEVLQYIYEKYGRDRAAMTAEFITYRPRSAVRDVGKALGLSLDRVDALAKSVGHYGEDERLPDRFREAGLNPDSPMGERIMSLVRDIIGFPRHLSQHVGGMVITHGLLSELVPIENAAMPDRTVIEWDKNDLDSLGILKVDCLSLGMLTAIHRCFDFVEQFSGRELTLANIPAEDPAVYDMVSEADTVGIFQIESRAQMSMLPRLRPRKFYDLVIEVAIVRPGPIQGDMVHPYLRRRSGEEQFDYPDERIKAVLHKTLGVPIFQEQAMRLAVVAAGFTPGEADQLRRAMGAWRRPGIIDQFHQKLIAGMAANGYSDDFAERLFRQVRGFGEYGFPESHAASFALLVYVSAWLKRYHHAEFSASLLNSQPMGFYAPAQLVRDAKQHGVEVRPIDVNHSDWDCTLEPLPAEESASVEQLNSESTQADRNRSRLALRLGFRMVSGLQQCDAESIVACRADGLFESFQDFCSRTEFSNAILVRLSHADTFGSLGITRRAAYWKALPEQKNLPLFNTAEDENTPGALPRMSRLAEVVADYQSAGLSLKDHPVKFIRSLLNRKKVVPAAELDSWPKDRRVRVAGLVLLRQRPSTARGITFVTLEDETGFSNLIIRQDVWEKFHRVARKASSMLASGILQRESGVIHVLVDRLEDLSTEMSEMQPRSRDFR